jgi:hypothetical protein
MPDSVFKGSDRKLTKLALYGVPSVGLYSLLYTFEDSLLELSAQGGWLFIVPVAIAFAFSFVHGGFTAHFWDLLGIKARK